MTPTQLESLCVAIAEKLGWDIPSWCITKRRQRGDKERSLKGATPDFGVHPTIKGDLPNYPTDPAAALDVIAALGKESYECELLTWDNGWRCDFYKIGGTIRNIHATAPTLPLAVALAAAKVWGIKI